MWHLVASRQCFTIEVYIMEGIKAVFAQLFDIFLTLRKEIDFFSFLFIVFFVILQPENHLMSD